MPETESRSWNRFNSDFRIPDTDEAARVAYEAKAAVDTWLQSTLARLEKDMQLRAEVQISTLKTNIEQSKSVLTAVQGRMVAFLKLVDELSLSDPKLAEAIRNLQAQTNETREAMEKAVKEWEQHGSKAVATAVSIAKTVATFV